MKLNHTKQLHFNNYLKLLTKILEKYNKYYEFDVVRDTPIDFIVNFYNSTTREKELQIISDIEKECYILYTKKDNFDKGKKIII